MRVTVDIVIFTIQSGVLKVLLVKRRIPPFAGKFAIPGGFVLEDEDLDQAALRELREETGVSEVYLSSCIPSVNRDAIRGGGWLRWHTSP